MASGNKRGGRGNGVSPEVAKRELIKLIASGESVASACRVVGKSVKTYEYYMANDADFNAAIKRARLPKEDRGRPEVPPFPEFSEQYLGQKLFWHQLQWLDLLEGREPRDLHPSQQYEPGDPDLLLVNTPPEHAKSTTLTMNYVAYRICENPDVAILIVSKTQEMAKKFLRGVKARLTSPAYKELQQAFGPPGGFDADSLGWSADQIYVSESIRTAGEKDPTVQALGIKGHIYGARADLIIMDDCVDLANAHEFEKQIEWIQSEVMSRVRASGRLIMVGTRLAPVDLYLEIRKPDRYPDDESPWTYLSQPAVLEFAEDWRDWVTLWPESNQADAGDRAAVQLENGMYEKWSGRRLFQKRRRVAPRTWSLVYMQQQVVEDAVFQQEAVAAAKSARTCGRLPAGMPGIRENGMDGLIVVAGLDPAMVGHTAAVVIGLDPKTGIRHVLDVHNQARMTPDGIRNLIYGWTERYGVSEWRIEKNAFQSFLTQDREVREYLNGRGVVLREHTTGMNKWDPTFGVASMATLFAGWETKNQLIELPSTEKSEGMKALIEQLVTWFPETKGKTDCVMALWFAEIKCRELVQQLGSYTSSFQKNRYATRGMQKRRRTFTVNELEDAQLTAWA